MLTSAGLLVTRVVSVAELVRFRRAIATRLISP